MNSHIKQVLAEEVSGFSRKPDRTSQRHSWERRYGHGFRSLRRSGPNPAFISPA